MSSFDALWSLLLGLPLGVLLGAAGTLTGVGGGFLLMPVLLTLFPQQPQGALAVVSLTVVFFNSLSGTVLSLRRERVRLKTGIVYGLVSLPLVWWGTQVQAAVDRSVFSAVFGGFVLASAFFLAFRPRVQPSAPRPGVWAAGVALSSVIGFVSGFFGVGGGFLFVPLLALFLRYPVVEAAATSQLIVGLGSLWALLLNARHELPFDPMLLGGLVAGVLAGAPLGTWASERWKPATILRILAALLALVGLKFLLGL